LGYTPIVAKSGNRQAKLDTFVKKALT